MSAVGVISYLLETNAPLLVEVAAAQIIVAPEIATDTVLPAINVHEIDAIERLTVSMGEAGRMVTARVQVMVHAADGEALARILRLVRWAPATKPGTVNGIKVDSILPDIEGQDLSQPNAGIFERSRDFIVTWFDSRP